MSESEFEFEPSVARALDRYALPLERPLGWEDVLSRAGAVRPARRPRRSAALALAATTVAALGLALATPLGGAITRTLTDFSDWLAGTPGNAVGEEEQRAFEESNARSWLAFPGSPKLRRLSRTEVDGVRYDLLGFRSGNSLCVRVVASGAAQGSTLACAPTDELRHDDAPVRVLLADWPVGRGEKAERIGFETYRSARATVTAGIAADGVSAVELDDDGGSHRVEAISNAFLYVANRPDVGQRVKQIRAELDDNRTVEIPFTVPPWGPAPGAGGATGEPGGPNTVERVVRGGRIGWVERREERGEPFDGALRERFETLRGSFNLLDQVKFGRVLTPDPGSAKRIAITIGESTHPLPGRPSGPALCRTLFSGGGTVLNSCSAPDEAFANGPFTFGHGVHGPGVQFATFAGIASDDVARLELFTATGNRIEVPLRDNVFLAELALTRLPAKLVGYDDEGRVIGIYKTIRQEDSAHVVGRPIVQLRENVPGVGSLELRAHRTREGGECWFARGTGQARGDTNACVPKEWREAPLRLGIGPVFVYGRARSDITRITLRYADGSEQQLRPGPRGYLLFVVPPAHRERTSRLNEVIGRDREGNVISRQRLGG